MKKDGTGGFGLVLIRKYGTIISEWLTNR